MKVIFELFVRTLNVKNVENHVIPLVFNIMYNYFIN